MEVLTYEKSMPGDKKIVFISDLHFDFTEREYNPAAAARIQCEFIAYIKAHFENDVLCLCGDFYNDYRSTLDFVKELDKQNVVGFFVLGNHDFWNGSTKSHEELIHLFEAETTEHAHFRLLVAGKKYFIDDICFIGDTGWTSFERDNRSVAMKQFMRLPDAEQVKHFSPKKIRRLHDKWIQFANSILSTECKTIILTHFPMTDFTQEDGDCWWSSQTGLIESDNCWKLFGHTHTNRQQKRNNISSQRGYDNNSVEPLGPYRNQYSTGDFGKLLNLSTSRAMTAAHSDIIYTYYSPQLIRDATKDIEAISKIKKRGYIRCSANRASFAALAQSTKTYLKRVNKVINDYLANDYIGYTYSEYLSKETIEAIFASITILENANFNNVREFFTAAVITGYVWNGQPYLISAMRPLDDYDIMRFYLMFLTIKKYKIGINEIRNVQKNKHSVVFANIEIYLPEVNGKFLNIKEVMPALKKTALLNFNKHDRTV